MKPYTYELPEDYPDNKIGVYDKKSGDSPHDLKAFGYSAAWKSPSVSFQISPQEIDPIPSTNLPVQLMHNDLAESIAKIAGSEVILIPVNVLAKGNRIETFSILHPTREVEIWDLEKSNWKGLDIPQWPKDKPMYMYDMILKNDIDEFIIAYNMHWAPMIVFNEEVAALLKNIRTWARTFVPDHYRKA